ncbi:hypothetical protein COX97_01885 [Candidatus Pacearchaeota archaeon CG_4_10_14_0_2_um_filter_05_32_18]|nr:MAG: hypothetical protein AUJ62_03010 [Candidatus Pacearchaeota archaeon CG1_02_32_21]PIZ83031.1 MAG: hypothetical protein COX97_01885 [Candidatus Pacearchaeota archaeon CG_4_10_14_0_2_um_filter_05_32_18]
MVEKDKIITEKVKRSGIFNFKDVYQFTYRWFVDEGYDVEEQKYIENVAGDSKDIEIKWVATKKVSDYFQNEIKSDWRIIGMTDVEVEKEGRKIKANKGTFEVKFTGNLKKDYEGSWEKSAMMKFLRGVYERYVIEARVKEREEKIIKDVEEILEQVKAFLTIEGMK